MDTPTVHKEPLTHPCQHSPPHNLSIMATWHSPNGQLYNQREFILTPQHFMSSINKANTRSFPGANIGSNHDLMLTTIKLKRKTKCFMKSPRIWFDLEKPKDLKIAEVLQTKVGGKFAALCILDNDVETLTNSLKEVLLSTADKVLGRQRKRFNCGSQKWFWICAMWDSSWSNSSTQALK